MALLHLQQSRSVENHVGLGPIQTEEMLNSKVSGQLLRSNTILIKKWNVLVNP